MKLGKQPYEHDARTVRLAKYFTAAIPSIPAHFDFDQGRAAFPLPTWGNLDWGDCVLAAQANAELRLERVEQRGTIKLTDNDVISRYRMMTGANTPGDRNDRGLIMLQAFRDWRRGWQVESTRRNYTIAAYGELENDNPQMLRQAIYLLHGIHLGFDLPITAQRMTRNGLWEVKPYDIETPEGQPGSWGGHCVFAKAYDADTVEILTWGMKIKVTDDFIKAYCDEAWSVVDSFDSWRETHFFDVMSLVTYLREIGASNIG